MIDTHDPGFDSVIPRLYCCKSVVRNRVNCCLSRKNTAYQGHITIAVADEQYFDHFILPHL